MTVFGHIKSLYLLGIQEGVVGLIIAIIRLQVIKYDVPYIDNRVLFIYFIYKNII